jgi:RHS repeat-associated protein
MENRQLDAIEIKVSSNLIRKYTFTYNTTDRVYSSDYGGIYYAGKHTLTSITQVGADGTLTLPTMTFTYQDKEVFRKTSTDQYTGNPGNPASLTWSFLTAVNSGYGGSVGFTYTQIPANTTYNLWTRQAVTTKTVNSGIGGNETYTYTYTGNPAYNGTGWDQEFRGWNEVKETDAAGNYQKHYFYTTGTIGGKDAEKLTGKEYQTQWYSSTNTLLDTKTYDWNWEQTGQYTAPPYQPVIPPTLVAAWTYFTGGSGYFSQPQGVAVSADGYLYVADTGNNRILKATTSGNLVAAWTYFTGGSGYFNQPQGIAVSADGYLYVADTGNNRILKATTSGNLVAAWTYFTGGSGYFNQPQGIAVSADGYLYVADTGNNRILKALVATLTVYTACKVYLSKLEETVGAKTSRTEYVHDSYGNVIVEKLHGDISTNTDDATVHRVFYPNTTANILNKPARERVYATITGDVGGSNLKKETLYYYDGNNTSLTTPPTKGNLTRLEQKKNASSSVSTYFTYDTYGNLLTEQDPNGNTTTWTFDTTYHTYPATRALPVSGLSESYTYDPGTTNLLTVTDVNGQTTSYEYDTFKRLTKVIKPGDSSANPSVEYQYNNWGTINQQNIKTITKIDAGDSLWQSQYFDGLGRVVQVHAEGEAGHTIVSSTTVFNNRGLVDKQYVPQDIASVLTSYQTPDAGWKYVSYAYDGLRKVTTQTNADGTSVSHDYATAWQDLVTNERGYKTRYYYDAFNRLGKVEELDASHQLYATTTYGYDVLGNLTQVVDNSNNTTTMTYDWLSRKTAMTDPDMGSWSYGYDNNGNLTTQTDARSQTITMTYDALNRLTAKTYPQGSGMTDVGYSYDSISGGNYGKGQRTGMTDALGTTGYKYDARGRLIEEKRTVDSVDYTTSFTYDGADRTVTVTYPTGETATQDYNGRGLPYAFSGSVAGDIVNSALYNNLGQITEINLNNGLKTIFGYWDTGGSYDTTGGYYGRLWRIRTTDDTTDLMDVKHTWDAGGNLASREDVLASETESFSYDFLDRLTGVSGPYSASYAYNAIGNITSMNGNSYTYGSQPHAVTAVGSTGYAYDNNGNMTTRDSQTITWDVENRPVSVSDNGTTATFIYDGDGNRVEKIENSETILYINKYYEKNLTTGNVTSYYYLGGRLVAMKQDSNLKYLHQDHLTGTALVTSDNGTSLGTMKYYPYGSTRSGSVPTDKLFTGQRLDDTGLYYYGARYYDPQIGRFISPDTIVPNPMNPQSFNRYSYCLNNPLRYIDPDGHQGYDWYMAMMSAGLNYQAAGYSSPAQAVAAVANQMDAAGASFSQPSLHVASSQPIETKEPKPPVIVWGYEGKGGIGYQYEKSVIVVKNNAGDYYRVTKTGHGVLLGVGVNLDIYEPGSEFNRGMQESWDVEFSASLYGIIQDEASATGGFDFQGRSFGYFSEHSYLVFNDPGVSLTVTHTTVEQISPGDIFSDMPRWVMNAYDKICGIDYRSILK